MSRKVIITKTAEKKLNKLFDYLSENWSEKVKKEFIKKLDHNLEIIKNYPEIFPKSDAKPGLHRAVITKQTTIFYRFNSSEIKLVTVFDSRQHPNKLYKHL